MFVTYLHRNWTFAQTDLVGKEIGTTKVEWLPAQVPGHVHLDLQAAGVIGDPFYRLNEIGVQWVDRADWSYQTTFDWTAIPDYGKRVLRFEGLDTVCSLFLNGEKVAEHDNMHVPLEVDVTDKLKEGENHLRIDFQSAVNVGEARMAAYKEEKGYGVIDRLLERSFVRKVQCMFGWDWGPRLVSAGVWKPVQLLEYAERIDDVHVTQTHHEDGTVTLHFKSTAEGEGTIRHLLFGPDGEEVGIIEGDGDLKVTQPNLWWPNGMGEQPLYELYSTLGDATLDQRIGLTEIQLLREKDTFGESFEFAVNGIKIWARGANWIPDHSFPSTITRARLREQLQRAIDQGMNMLRVWGGGMYESDDFYSLCDELGIMVWQDFLFGCAYYPDDGIWPEAVRIEAESNVRRIRNHPSLALWCGNNENHQMWHDKWGGADKSPDRYLGEHLYHEVLPDVVRRLDPSTPYIASSPIGGDNPNIGGIGDQHCWDVWHGRGDWKYYADSTARFSSEYGFASSCSTNLWKRTISKSDWSSTSPVVRWHDKTAKGTETFHNYVRLHYPDWKSLEDWVYYSQLNQRDAMRFAIEHYRRSEFCKGSLIWQLNDCWPVQSWALLDSEGTYKAAAYELRRLYDDVLVGIHRDKEIVQVWVCNDGLDPVLGYVALEAFSTVTGDMVKDWEPVEISLNPGDRKMVLEANVAGLSNSETLVHASLDQLWNAWRLLGEPKDTRFAKANLTVSTAQDGFLVVEADAPAVDVFFYSEDPALRFQDNFLTFETAGTETVRYRGPVAGLRARSLAGEHPISITRSPL